MTTRRGFLAGLAAAGCGATRSAARPRTAGWNPAGIVDERRFACGLQTGDPLPDSLLVSVRVDAATIEIRYARLDDGWVEQDPIEVQVVDGVGQVELVGLRPDAEYAVVAFVGDRRSVEARARTALAPGSERTLRVAATCCFGAAGSPFRSASRVAEEGVDFAILLGDAIYAGPTVGQWEDHWTEALASTGMRDLLLSTAVVATWDDHEVLNDWTWDEVGDAALDALDSFRRALPQRLGGGPIGIWRSLRWGDRVEVFVLDARGERTADRILSDEQLQWLLDGLETSDARWKLVVNSVPLTDLSRMWEDANLTGWGPFPAQRAAVLDALRGRTDVIVLTGDVHFGGIAAIGPAGSADDGSLEILCGPAGSKIAELGMAAAASPQFDPIILHWNTVVLELEQDRAVVRFEGDDGTLAERVLPS